MNSNQPAFPMQDAEINRINGVQGLTKREYFAAMAMQGLLANSIYHNPNEKHKMITVPGLSSVAINYADELLKQLEQ